MAIHFMPITSFPRGTLCALLRDGYSFDPKYEQVFLGDWMEFDNFFYDNPHIADRYGFMTVLEGQAIGFVSWDPRQMPTAIIGHNCVASVCKGQGYGRAQMREAVRRIKTQGAHKIIVTTDEGLIPAQRMYESAGFIRVTGEPVQETPPWRQIHYEQIV